MLIKKRSPYKKRVPKAIIAILVILFVAISAGGTWFYLDMQHKNYEKQQIEDTRLAREAVLAAKEAKKHEAVYINLPGAAPVKAIVDDYHSITSIWSIVSKTHPISVDYVPSPIQIPNVAVRSDKSDAEKSVRTDIVSPTERMFGAALTEGYSLMIGSGYRSAALQKLYFDSLASSVGESVANQTIARSGQSEHQTGLAMDISTVSRQCYLDNCFASTADGQWLVNNSYKYGFILRYPEGKESITGYSYESWHFRYVGVELATAIHQSGLTFDEVWPYLETARNTLIQNGAILP